MNVDESTRSKLRQIQFSCLGALVALGGTKYLMDFATEQESWPAACAAMASLVMLILFALHLRDVARSL